jgi:hypothetical protein
VIYPDGACLACAVPEPLLGPDVGAWDPNVGPGFLPDGRLAVSIEGPEFPSSLQVGAINTDGIGFQSFAMSDLWGLWQQTAWSPTGQLAAVRSVNGKPEVFVINPATASARQVTRDGASAPNWAPDGRRLAVVHRGWIELIGSAGGRMRRLTRGRVPAWAPNGKQLAFVGAHDRLFVISVRGGSLRPVGHIRALRVDWRPVTGTPPPHCQAPAGSSVLATSPDATVTIDEVPLSQPVYEQANAFSVLGCMASDGRERVLESTPPPSGYITVSVGLVAVAGDYAALVNESYDPHMGSGGATVSVFDLRTATAVANLGGSCALMGCRVDQLVLGSDGITAAHTYGVNCAPPGPCTTVEQIVANDSTGTHVLDSIPNSGLVPPFSLSQLALSGHTLTWSHAGTPKSAQLN